MSVNFDNHYSGYLEKQRDLCFLQKIQGTPYNRLKNNFNVAISSSLYHYFYYRLKSGKYLKFRQFILRNLLITIDMCQIFNQMKILLLFISKFTQKFLARIPSYVKGLALPVIYIFVLQNTYRLTVFKIYLSLNRK